MALVRHSLDWLSKSSPSGATDEERPLQQGTTALKWIKRTEEEEPEENRAGRAALRRYKSGVLRAKGHPATTPRASRRNQTSFPASASFAAFRFSRPRSPLCRACTDAARRK